MKRVKSGSDRAVVPIANRRVEEVAAKRLQRHYTRTDRCTRLLKSTGERCRRSAVFGAKECLMHSGKVPVVQDAAMAKINAAAPTMVQQLIEIATNPGVEPKDRISAAKDLLDRAGYGAAKKHEVQVSHGPGEDVRQMILEERQRRRALAEAADERGIESGKIIEAEVLDDPDPQG